MEIVSLNSNKLAEMMLGGYRCLKLNESKVDDLNVFPVPDGDTGANMVKTLGGAVNEALECANDGCGAYLKRFARGALMSARGNSGVILSQFFRGFADAAAGKQELCAADMSELMKSGVARSYSAVINPAEGTILTVMKDASEKAKTCAKTDLTALFGTVTEEMRASLRRTPDLLPVLKEAGVVDSGGAGFLCVFEGMCAVLNGENPDGEHLAKRFEDSAAPVVTGDDAAERKKYGVVAVCAGDGFEHYFGEIGVDALILARPGDPPSTESFVRAFSSVNADCLFVLPNDPNFILSARQAAQLFDRRVEIIETKSLAEGYSALSMMDLNRETPEQVIDDMLSAVSNVITGLVTRAVRDTRLGGVDVKTGDYIGLADHTLLCADIDMNSAVVSLLQKLPCIADKEVVTVFYGAEVDEDSCGELEQTLSKLFPRMEFGFVRGGQELYHYIISIE